MEPSLLPASNITQAEKTLGVLMHLFCLVGLPILGPLMVWLPQKGRSRYLDQQGRELLSFHISYLIYAFLAGQLTAVLVGIPLLLSVLLALVVFTIKGVIHSVEGRIYRFPLTIRML